MEKAKRDAIGFIGLGSMGAPMARRLLDHGESVIVYDIDTRRSDALAEHGAVAAGSAAEIAAQTRVVMLCLPSLEAISDTLEGENGLVKGGALRLCVNFCTTGAAFAHEMRDTLGSHGVALVDSPITGGAAGAAAGTLSMIVSGSAGDFEAVRPILGIMARHLFHVGDVVGQAQTMKLINNLLSYTALAVTSEAFVMGAKAGLDPDRMVEVINTGTGRNSATEFKMPRNVLPRTFDYGAQMSIVQKDLSLCLDEAEALRVPMPVSSAVRQLFLDAIAHGSISQDSTTVIRWLEQAAGVEVRGRSA